MIFDESKLVVIEWHLGFRNYILVAILSWPLRNDLSCALENLPSSVSRNESYQSY
jgi:hypothetical protein